MNNVKSLTQYDGLFETSLLFLGSLGDDDDALIERFARKYDAVAYINGRGLDEDDAATVIRSALAYDVHFGLEIRPWLELTEEVEHGLLSGKHFLFILDEVEKAASPWTLLGRITDFSLRLSRFCRINGLAEDQLFLVVALDGLGSRLVAAIAAKK